MMTLSINDLPGLFHGLEPALAAYVDTARTAVSERVVRDGRVDRAACDAEQRALHGLSWIGAVAEAMRQSMLWGKRLAAEGRLGEGEKLVLGWAWANTSRS